MVPTPRRSSLGAYGFRLTNIPEALDLLVEAPERWPELELVRVAPEGEEPAEEQVTADHARLRLSGGGWAEVDRVAARAELQVPTGTTDGALVHPFLASVALVMSRWRGHEGFHGGGIVAGGGVWGVLGDKTAGKSTLLAWLGSHGVGVMSDDVLIIDGMTVLAGPRSVDLREEAAAWLGAGEPMGRVGARDRWRVPLPAVPAELPLRGWITLAWGDEIAVEPLRGAERFQALLPHRGVRLVPPDPAGLVRFSALPHLRFTRPQDWEQLPAASEQLLAALG
ncbi:hypothetical protein OJ997_08555 [Solirubrobacter phytolaccae]|uniref:HPr kinase/phosphorylase C-terminal domain-containing protein n=1 Tax=Solirubrobacter phytolaccae TaxID=1404360 RepID=A0A9X3N658_9ACTN|nr:hypothetical protein [Solirubrobacter phytolaccae]MDA0180344.1 hypothetical protein [Solirubrobacter phytolaccae]